MATLFHMDVLRLTNTDGANNQFIEQLGSGTLTTQDDPDGALYPLPNEYHPLLNVIADSLRLGEIRDEDGVRRFFYRELGSGDYRLIIQVQPYYDYLVASQQDAKGGALVAHDRGVDLRVHNHGLLDHFACLAFTRLTGTLDAGVETFVLNTPEIDALIAALTDIREGRTVEPSPLLRNAQWRERLNGLAEERVGIPYKKFQESRGEVAA